VTIIRLAALSQAPVLPITSTVPGSVSQSSSRSESSAQSAPTRAAVWWTQARQGGCDHGMSLRRHVLIP
jgi:hypothetical protein